MQHSYPSNTAFMIADKHGHEAYKMILLRMTCNKVHIIQEATKSQSRGNRASIEAYVIAGTDIEKETYINCMGGFMYD